MIHFSGLTKKYGSTEVLKDLEAEVKKGEAIAIIGPSGSGKSTLLRCMNFLEHPDQGTIAIDGLTLRPEDIHKNSKALRELRKRVGMVFQHFHLFPNMTVFENITFSPMKTLGFSRQKATEIALELLEKVGLKDFKDRYPARLSGGQKQRVAIARALAMQPKVMLFDEPTSALDPEMVKEVLDVIREVHKEQLTMLIVTHEMQFAREVSDQIWFLDQGQILEKSVPQEFFTAPKSARAKQFLSRVL